MRLYITLVKNTVLIPYNYQHLLTGVIHKWLGKDNDEHGKSSQYSFSWLQNTVANEEGINLTNNSYFFISSYNQDLLKKFMKGVLADPEMFCGIRVTDVQIKDVPVFSTEERFLLTSPILIRQRIGDKTKHITFKDENFEELLTENLKGKLRNANLPDTGVSVKIDKSYAFSQTKLVDYKGIKNKTSLVPVIIKGTPEQIAFAWSVGLGNSTGIGFGSLK